jgi:hypothetical protein
MAKRYRLPLFTTRIGLPTGSKEAASDGWFYPKNLAEETALQEAGCEADDLDDPMRNDGTLRPDEVAQFRSVVSGDGVLDAASAGQSSAWFGYVPGMRLAYALDSGTTSTTFSIDFSADGVTSLGQAFTGTWASSTVAEITPPLYLTNPQARFLRFNVLTGGPLSVSRNI